jgi:glycosyltransferase involved in cell wall biosynthesis
MEESFLDKPSTSARCVAVLGREDHPTDAVEEYCLYLGSALAELGVKLDLVRVPWLEKGWRLALRELREKTGEIRGTRFLLQYTALSWSRHGFSLAFLRVIRSLKKRGAWCGVVFHDVEAYYGNRLVDRLRRALQVSTMRKALQLADLGIMTIPVEKIPWVPRGSHNIVFIPVGANLPSPEKAWYQQRVRARPPTVAAFSLSGKGTALEEVRLITQAARYSAERIGPLRLVVLGRNSEIARKQLEEELTGTRVDITVYGLLAADQIVRVLGSCDVLLFVRGPISSRRGSAIAGIACGLPVVAREGWETGGPALDAGVHLLSANNTDGFGPALVQVLTDADYRASLAERSRRAQEQHFSWRAIAAKYMSALQINSPKESIA